MQSDRVVCLNMQELFQLENHILVSASLICYNVEAKERYKCHVGTKKPHELVLRVVFSFYTVENPVRLIAAIFFHLAICRYSNIQYPLRRKLGKI